MLNAIVIIPAKNKYCPPRVSILSIKRMAIIFKQHFHEINKIISKEINPENQLILEKNVQNYLNKDKTTK